MTKNFDGIAALLPECLGLVDADQPFPWQKRLLGDFLNLKIPNSLDLPTGLGKTSVMALWLLARAGGAKLPRRLVYVVDRRAVVDQATTEAERLRDWVEAQVDVKKALGLERPLPISTLRGQYVDNREWMEDPASPAIIVGTVDMVGSRLLFEGYGVSRKMRPYHAGLLGADTLAVLDEAHLVPPFQKLLEAIEAGRKEFGPRIEAHQELVPAFKLLALSATGRQGSGPSFSLNDEDLRHPIVKKRLEAKKSLSLVELSTEETLGAKLAEQVWELAEQGKKLARVLVFSDQRKVASRAKDTLAKLAKAGSVEVETEFFVGGRRVFERQQAQKRLGVLGFIAGNQADRTRSAFLFATSAAEVGVDLDADHMVCDLVAWERMVQRLGRVNRRGEVDAKVVVLCEPSPEEPKQKAKEDDEKYQARLKKFREKQGFMGNCMKAAEKLKGDASPKAISALKKSAENDAGLHEIIASATTPTPLRPALNRALVDAWSLTSLEKHTGRPEVEPWLRGWLPGEPLQTTVLWRAHLPVREGARPKAEEIEAFFEAAPPHASEMLETETYRVADWLGERTKRLLEAEGEKPSLLGLVLEQDGSYREELKLEKIEGKELHEKIRNAVLVVDARVAGLKEGLLDDTEDAVPRSLDDGQAWLDGLGYRVRRLEGVGVAGNGGWREKLRFALSESEDNATWLVVEKQRSSTNEEDRAVTRSQLLEEHQQQAERKARALAQRLGLEKSYEDLLARATRLHDEGKKAVRWQRAFNAPKDGVYGKTEGPIRYSLLDGYRHEFGSLAYAAEDAEFKKLDEPQKDLALHLIAAHHGFARPTIKTAGCDGAPPSALKAKADEVALRFARLQEAWGPWGLAWWEALLRAADQQASREHETQGEP